MSCLESMVTIFTLLMLDNYMTEHLVGNRSSAFIVSVETKGEKWTKGYENSDGGLVLDYN